MQGRSCDGSPARGSCKAGLATDPLSEAPARQVVRRITFLLSRHGAGREGGGKAEGWRDMPDGVAARRSVNGRGRCPDPFSPFRSFEKLRDGRTRFPAPSFLQNRGTAMRARPASRAERRAEPGKIVGGISRRSASRTHVGRIAVPRFCKSLPIRRKSCRSAFRTFPGHLVFQTFSGHPAGRAPADKLYRHALPPCRE